MEGKRKRREARTRKKASPHLRPTPSRPPQVPKRRRYAFESTRKKKTTDLSFAPIFQSNRSSPLPASLLLLPIRLISSILAIRAAIRLRGLILRRLLRVIPQRHPVAPNIRALNTLVSGAGFAQAHDGASAGVLAALGLGVPQAAFVVFVVRVAAAGAAADGEEPEERGDDGEGGGDPGDGEGTRADFHFDVVGVEEGVEGAGEGGEEDCGCEGGEEGEEGGDLEG